MNRVWALSVAAVSILVLSFVACGQAEKTSNQPQQYTITINGANVATSGSPTANQGATASFTITPAAGYIKPITVGGTCPQGGWNGDLYTTGAITSNCTLTLSSTGTPTSPPSTTTTTTCGNGQTTCSNVCVTTATDPKNCGACGTACASGQSCSNGQCAAGSCSNGQTTCSGSCVNTATDNNNCGGCGKACATGQTCANGSCGSAQPSACSSGISSCSGVCTDLKTDNQNCGSCGNLCNCASWAPDGINCLAPGFCVNGACGCSSGWTMCGGYCSDFQTDILNCGSCGHACGGGQTCRAGVCMANLALPCPLSGQTRCSGTCVDTQTDHGNCGACGYACGSAQTCTNGNCTL